MATYHAVATRSDNWWAIEVPEHPGVFTQARRIDQVPDHVADALSLWLDSDVSPDDIEVEIHAGDFSAAAEAVRAARERVERARADATTMMSEAVAQGVAAGLPMRDIGRMLGVSHQRVAAIAREAVGTSRRATKPRRPAKAPTQRPSRPIKVNRPPKGSRRMSA